MGCSEYTRIKFSCCPQILLRGLSVFTRNTHTDSER